MLALVCPYARLQCCLGCCPVRVYTCSYWQVVNFSCAYSPVPTVRHWRSPCKANQNAPCPLTFDVLAVHTMFFASCSDKGYESQVSIFLLMMCSHLDRECSSLSCPTSNLPIVEGLVTKTDCTCCVIGRPDFCPEYDI
jgi:hypothetical protein